MFKRESGITLIALVITIIVLLILAGVSINLLSGENGVLKRAGDTRRRTEISSLQENVQLALTSRETEKIVDGTNSKNLKDDLEEKISDARVEWANGLNDVCYVIKGENYVTVYEDGEIIEGKVNIWDGITVECPEFKKENNVWNWYIYSAGQLKFFADFVNNGNSLTGSVRNLTSYVKTEDAEVTMSKDSTIYLMNNIDLGARPGEGATEEAKWATNPDKLKWTPIGIDFTNVQNNLGTFEGNGHTIKGVYVSVTNSYVGLFQYSNVIRNLTIKNSYIQGGDFTGGIVGFSLGLLQNCHNKNTIVKGANNYTGGIVGSSQANIEKCTNTGHIIGNTYVGGIIALAGPSGIIKECDNSGIIDAEEGHHVGGIVGYGDSSTKATECTNNSKIIGVGNIGGISGAGTGIIEKCTNSGDISGKERQVGGITGAIGNESVGCRIDECTNTGNVSGNEMSIAGIAGWTENCTINRCCNIGTIIGKGNYTGGIGGNVNISTINGCYNSGNINGVGYSGGIIGRLRGTDSSPCTVTNCYNKGEITGTTKISEIIGYIDEGNNILNNLFYLSKGTSTLTAIGETDDDNNKKIMAVNDVLTYEQFKTWIEQQ